MEREEFRRQFHIDPSWLRLAAFAIRVALLAVLAAWLVACLTVLILAGWRLLQTGQPLPINGQTGAWGSTAAFLALVILLGPIGGVLIRFGDRAVLSASDQLPR